MNEPDWYLHFTLRSPCVSFDRYAAEDSSLKLAGFLSRIKEREREDVLVKVVETLKIQLREWMSK